MSTFQIVGIVVCAVFTYLLGACLTGLLASKLGNFNMTEEKGNDRDSFFTLVILWPVVLWFWLAAMLALRAMFPKPKPVKEGPGSYRRQHEVGP